MLRHIDQNFDDLLYNIEKQTCFWIVSEKILRYYKGSRKYPCNKTMHEQLQGPKFLSFGMIALAWIGREENKHVSENV